MYNYVQKTFDWTLSEVGQKSPVRYKVLLETNGVLTEASPWLKCTDYFNDIVYATLFNDFFVSYGVNNESFIITGDLFVSIKDYQGKKIFKENLEVINEFLARRGHEPNITVVSDVDDLPTDLLVLQIPRYYITNTAYMSLVFALIRACTYKVKLTQENIFTTESKFQAIFLTPIARITDRFDKIIDAKNKEKVDQLAYLIDYYQKVVSNTNPVIKLKDIIYYQKHNNGLHGWCMNLKDGMI